MLLLPDYKLYCGNLGDLFVTVSGSVYEAFGDKSVKIHSVTWEHKKHRPIFDLKPYLTPTAILDIEEALIEKATALGERYGEKPEDHYRDNFPEGA